MAKITDDIEFNVKMSELAAKQHELMLKSINPALTRYNEIVSKTVMPITETIQACLPNSLQILIDKLNEVQQIYQPIINSVSLHVDEFIPKFDSLLLTLSKSLEQINLEECQIREVLEKGDKVVDLFFNREVKELLINLKEYRTANGIDTEYVFISKKNGEYRKVATSTLGLWAKKIGVMIGLEHGQHCHDFRHSGATLLKNAGMPLEEVSTLLNHASTDVTRKFYIKEDNKKLKQSKAKYEI